jgi:hypothetical protein
MKKVLAFLVVLLHVAGSIWATEQIVINEIMYNSIGPDVEYIELYNKSEININLTGWYILDDNDSHEHCLLQGNMVPGEYLVVAGDVTVFRNQYPGVTNVNANCFDPNGNGWSLGNGGDAVRLFDASGILHDHVAYQDGGDWPGSPDGNGPSLELIHPDLDNALPISWDPSTVDWGTPGAQNSAYKENIMPVCKDGSRNIDLPTSSDAVTVTVIAYDYEGLASVKLYVDTGAGYVAQSMYDDGLNGDGVAGDSIFTTLIQSQNSGTLVKYYAIATDDIGQTDTWPNNAPAEYHAYTVDYTPPALRITEIMAVNESGVKDEFNEYEDWFEIYNAGSAAINLGGMFISDDLGTSRAFKLPSMVLNPGGYFLFWADNDVEQGDMHVDFKLSSGGEAIALFETVDHGNVLIDGWKFGIMSADVSMGFYPQEGNAPEYLTVPTPGASNESSALFSPICINEFQSTSDFGGTDDWIEIYNRGNQPYDLSGCFLSDNRGEVAKWTFPNGTVLNSGEFLVIYEDALGFGLSSTGSDVIMLTAVDSTTGLDFYDFGSQSPDMSEGRYPDGTNNWEFFKRPTRGTSNSNQTAANDDQAVIPIKFALFQNYPNPFNPGTTISFSLPETGKVSLKIFNVLGKEVATLVDGRLDAGDHFYHWQANDMASGLYYITIKAGAHHQTKKMLLIR